jgi:hypothetical protein
MNTSRCFLLLLLLVFPPEIFSQVFRNSEDGVNFPTKGKYRVLCVFVNIIYDVTPDDNPAKENGTWKVLNEEGINLLPPDAFFREIFDVRDAHPRKGVFTRFLAESSFDSLAILGDFMSVEIKQSHLLGKRRSFNSYLLTDSVISYINTHGGVHTIYGHNSISDYDHASFNKRNQSNNMIDQMIFIVLNSTATYGSMGRGQGFMLPAPSRKLKFADGEYGIESMLCMGIGTLDLKNEPGILIHEFAHSLLGGNSFHSSGGNHLGSRYVNTFMYKQSGYGLFAYNLRSTNAYERWRLGWRSPSNEPLDIAADGIDSDIIEPFEGERIFYLRDFVTTGDAIRIKLPYKDSEQASNQYIWLENHQLGRNGKMDGINYHFFPSEPFCIPLGNPGVYAYIQVGKDVKEGTQSEVYPSNETDNIRMINAEGNYNMLYVGDTMDCKNWTKRPIFEYVSPNPLSGANDQTEVFNTTNEKIQVFSDFLYVASKMKDGILYNQMQSEGDNFDGFENGSVMDISSNPTPINAVTHYAKYYKTAVYIKVDDYRDTRKKYLTGLSIRMDSAYNTSSGEVFKVTIRWDDYDVKQHVNWAGDIVLKEKLNLQHGKTIQLEQNRMPNQMVRDSASGFFAPPTRFVCDSGAIMKMEPESQVLLKDKSSFLLENNTQLIIKDKAALIVEEGSTLMIKNGSSLTIEGAGKIIIKKGGFLCVESGADIYLKDKKSIIKFEKGSVAGVNNVIFADSDCLSTILYSGKGKIKK